MLILIHPTNDIFIFKKFDLSFNNRCLIKKNHCNYKITAILMLDLWLQSASLLLSTRVALVFSLITSPTLPWPFESQIMENSSVHKKCHEFHKSVGEYPYDRCVVALCYCYCFCYCCYYL